MLDAHAHAMQVNLCKANTEGVTFTMEKSLEKFGASLTQVGPSFDLFL